MSTVAALPERTNELDDSLAELGLRELGPVNWNLKTAALYEAAVRRGEGKIADQGPLVVSTGDQTGRSPNDKFTVCEPSSEQHIWWGKVNKPFAADKFAALLDQVREYFRGREVFVQDCLAGADPQHEVKIRVITENAWHALFARTMFIRPDEAGRTIAAGELDFTILHAPHMCAIPERDGTNSETFVIVNFGLRLAIIGGTRYAGEIKKSVFFLMNYLLPQQGVLSMHASANVDAEGSGAIFFGLSGTGKTTLSADPSRSLIGDDEHGWSDRGVFNFEGGCYAKVINLSAEKEPLIYATTQRFGTVLENVVMEADSRRIDMNDGRYTENTRAAYPIDYIPNAVQPSRMGQPKHVVMLTCDAFGVLPPLAKLTPEQAMYHFLSGYTAKVAGTERGLTEPQTTFSTCFGAPFMALRPGVYAELLGQRIKQHQVSCWLINTGWSGGPYGVGSRMDISHTRCLLNAALAGQLEGVEFHPHPVFKVAVPKTCPGVPSEVLDPRNTWSDPAAYDIKASQLARAFAENFAAFANDVAPEVCAAGPVV